MQQVYKFLYRSSKLIFYFQGITRLFLTRIPFYKDVIVSSFSCNSCGYHNSELQPGGKIQEKGVKYTVNIQNEKVYIVTCRSRDKGHVSMDKKSQFMTNPDIVNKLSFIFCQ